MQLVYGLLIVVTLSTMGCIHSSRETVTTLMDEYSTTSGSSMQLLDEWVQQGASAITVFEPYLSDPDAKKRWLAVYVIGRVGTPEGAQALLTLLEDDNEIVRIAAAGTLVNKGYSEALPVLIAGLDSVGVIEYLHPQSEIAQFCREVLTTYTGQTFTETTDWEQWWSEHSTKLQWNETTQLYQ